MKGKRDELAALRKLREVSSLLADEPDPAKLVPLVLDQAVALVGAERGFAILLGGGKELEVAAARNIDREEIQGPEHKVSRSIVGRVAQTGKAELILDAASDDATKDIASVKLLKLHSVLCVPLRAHGETLGVVYVDHRYTKGEFDKEDLATLEAFAVPAAMALDAARKRAALETSSAELARRVETVTRLRAELAERYREKSREANRLRDAEAARGAALVEGEFPGVVARSPAMKRVLALVSKVAPSDAPVLLIGESGTGKEVLARALHALSPRSKGPFVAENCGALADPLLESELFGHEKGAFTGAVGTREGLFEAARAGTLLLDEVGEMSPNLQVKLLRVLEEREVRRVGGHERIAVDARIVAATHRDLEAMVAAGTFRSDIYYRLNVVRIEVPPLRERAEDVPALLDRFLTTFGKGEVTIEPQAREILLSYSWPGNVRELENEVQRLCVLVGTGGVVRPGLLSPAILGVMGSRSEPVSAETSPGELWRLEDVERAAIERALRRANGNKTVAARLLGLAKTSLYNRMEKLGLHGAEGT